RAGGAPRAISSGFLPYGHVFTKRRDLLPPEPEDAAKPVRGVEATDSIALVDDAAGEAGTYAGKPRDLLHGGVIDVERTRIDRRRGRGEGRGASPGRREAQRRRA